jgi:glycogen phosphorylase
MKVLVNGGINLSELDGWWAEAYTPQVGWALGDGQEHGDNPAWDASEAEALYERLEQEVVPEFYSRDEKGIPVAWVARMRESMASLTPRFSASRAVQEYTEDHYLPAADAYRARAADKGSAAQRLVDWRSSQGPRSRDFRFGSVAVEDGGGNRVISVEVHLGDAAPDAVRVELYADGAGGAAPVRQEMGRVQPDHPGGMLVYRATVAADRPASDYTARIIPHFDGLAVPLEAGWITWQK